MKFTPIILISIFSLSLASAECPVDALDVEGFEKIISEQQFCYEAVEIAHQCAAGSLIDLYKGRLVEEKCNKDFEHIGSKDNQTYEYLTGLCHKKYKDEMGTIYRSIESFCRLDVAKMFSELFSPIQH